MFVNDRCFRFNHNITSTHIIPHGNMGSYLMAILVRAYTHNIIHILSILSLLYIYICAVEYYIYNITIHVRWLHFSLYTVTLFLYRYPILSLSLYQLYSCIRSSICNYILYTRWGCDGNVRNTTNIYHLLSTCVLYRYVCFRDNDD